LAIFDDHAASRNRRPSKLRPGNVHSADGWRALLEPVIARYRGVVKHLYFRGDTAFANPEIYELLEAEGASYTIRLPANRVLRSKARSRPQKHQDLTNVGSTHVEKFYTCSEEPGTAEPQLCSKSVSARIPAGVEKFYT
jgi:hypothetical protein